MDNSTRWLASPLMAELTASLRVLHSEATHATLQTHDGDAESLGHKMLAHRARLDVVSALEMMHERAREDLKKEEELNNG